MKRLWIYLCILSVMVGTIYPTLSHAAADAESGTPANLIIGRGLKTPVFKAGSEAVLAIPLDNTGSLAAENIIITFMPDDINNAPFEIAKLTSKKTISSIDGRSSVVTVFDFNIPKTTAAKIYGMTINVEYSSPSGGRYSASEKIYIKVENDYKMPELRLLKVEIDGDKLLAGSSKRTLFRIENTGDLAAKDVEVRLGGFENNGLKLETPIDTQIIKSIEGKRQGEAAFKILGDKDMESGTYSLDLFLTYKDENNQKYTRESKVYFPLEGSGTQGGDFSFENLIYPQKGIEPNENFDISFDLKNNGEQEIKGIKVSVQPGEDILPRTASVRTVGNLLPGKSTPISFTLFPKEDIASKNYPIQINVEYDVKNNKTTTTESVHQYVGVFVNQGSNQKLTPKIIIDNYSYGGEYVKAGETFPLHLSFLNTHRDHSVYNIRVSISSEGEIFSPMGSSSSMFIQEIPANGKLEKTLTLKPKNDAEYKTYNVFAEIEYEDDKGNKYTTKEFVGIPVVQQIQLRVGEVELPRENYPGNPMAVSLDFYNVGRALIRNLMVRIEGDFEIQDGSMYVGNLEAGKDNYFDATIVSQNPGPLAGTIIFEYDDAVGNHYIEEKGFTATVMEPMAPPMPMEEEMGMEPASSASAYKKYGMLIGGVSLLAVGGWFFYKKRRKKAEAVNEDE